MFTPNDRDPVDVLAEEFADRLRRGEHPSVSDYAANHPSHAEQLREVLPAVAQMEQLKRFKKAVVLDSITHPDRLGDFRILRELGRGGMGVVFEAVQESLGRRVALKILASQSQLTPERRERFVREAKAAAKLHHTNIVPVFGVGEQEGLSYYVMQLIPGQSLQAIVAGWKHGAAAETAGPIPGQVATTLGMHPEEPRLPRPTVHAEPGSHAHHPRSGDWAFIAEAGAQAAEALHYAHQQGVLHRDVKPANLLLDPKRQVWVADFGVAKLVDSRTLTATGDILGTLQYLAPECLHGTADVRSDVYGLGATLYEMLTLAPPFSAETPAGLIKQIADAEPASPRSIDRTIPRDLETIVLKALAREPSRRYASAEMLADDLRAFLDDRPIRARRVTAIGRGARWCRKNPAVAMLSFSTLAALVLAAVVGWMGYARTQAALEAEAVRRDEAEQASAKLEANLKLSLEAFEAVFVAAGGNDFRAPPVPGFGGRPQGGPFGRGPNGLPDQQGPGMRPGGDLADRAAVLEAVLEFYEKFAQQNATNPRLQFEAAKAHRRVGEVNQWLGRGEPVASFRRAAEMLEALVIRFPDSNEMHLELVQIYALAPFEIFTTPAQAEAQLERAANRVHGLDMDVPQRRALGGVLLKLGWLREQSGRADEAMQTYRETIAVLSLPREASPRFGGVSVERGVARQRLASLLVEAGELEEAERVLNDGVAELRTWGRGGPNNGSPAAALLPTTLRQLAELREKRGNHRGAELARNEANQVQNSGGKGPEFPFIKDGGGPGGRQGGPPRDGPPKR